MYRSANNIMFWDEFSHRIRKHACGNTMQVKTGFKTVRAGMMKWTTDKGPLACSHICFGLVSLNGTLVRFPVQCTSLGKWKHTRVRKCLSKVGSFPWFKHSEKVWFWRWEIIHWVLVLSKERTGFLILMNETKPSSKRTKVPISPFLYCIISKQHRTLNLLDSRLCILLDLE